VQILDTFTVRACATALEQLRTNALDKSFDSVYWAAAEQMLDDARNVILALLPLALEGSNEP
jgi:hypothetical protein